jgi:hypothetical protein
MARNQTTTRARRTSTRPRKPASNRLRVSFTDADRVRRHLLSEQVEVLNTRDIRTMLTILNDVYPSAGMRSRRHTASPVAPKPVWQPFLLGIGIGLVLLVGALTVV